MNVEQVDDINNINNIDDIDDYVNSNIEEDLHNLNKSNVSKFEIFASISISIVGFLLGGAKIFNVIAPFGVAIVSSIPIIYLLPCIIGTILSTILFINPTQIGFIIISILFAGGLRVIFNKISNKYITFTSKPLIYSLISISAMIIGVLIQALINFTGSVSFILLFMQVILAGCFAYFFAIAIDALLNHKISLLLSNIQLISIGILTIVLICGASSFQLVNLNLGVILSVILVYVITNRFNVFGASIISIVVSIALNLFSPTMLAFTSMLVIASFISGLFSTLGKLFQIIAFLTVTSFAYLFLANTIDLTPRIIDIFFATSIYILLPNKLFKFLDESNENIQYIKSFNTCNNTTKTNVDINDNINDNINDLDINNIDIDDIDINNIDIDDINLISSMGIQKDVCEKLYFACDTMNDLKDNLTTISKKFLNIEYNTITSIPDAVSNVVCKSCSRNLSCWGKNYDDTADNFNSIISKLKVTGNIDEVNMPDYFLAKCCKLTRLIEAINDSYNSFLIRQNVKRQVCESRAMVFEQFSSISDLLCEISQDLESIKGYDENLAKKAMSAFCDLEEKPIKITCTVDSLNKKTIEIYTDKILQTSPEILCKAICLATKYNFDIPDISITNAKTKICFIEKPKYKLDFSLKQSCFKDNTLSGDTVETFSNTKGQAFFLLSDGMGKGTRAAIDSVMTCSIMAKLLKAGFGTESSIKLINSSLVVKSTDESLATIDLASIDLYSGKIQIVKAGATYSFIYSKEEVEKVSTQSLPVGILQKPEYDSYNSSLSDGDIVLLISDGVTNSDIAETSWIAETLNELAKVNSTPELIANSICNEAKIKSDSLQGDDITVLAIKISSNF